MSQATAGSRTGQRIGGASYRVRHATLGFIIVAVAMEALPRSGVVSPLYLPPFSIVAAELFERMLGGALWMSVAQTLKAMAIGLSIAVPAALILGLVVGSSPWLLTLTGSLIEFLRTIPSVALIPLAVLLYGTSIGSSLLLIVYATFWQVLIQVLYGVQDVDPVARETAVAYGLGRLARLRYVTWPTCAPYAVTGIRLATAVALILAVTSELVIGSPGLGRDIAVAQGSGAVAPMYALVVMTGLVGLVISGLTRWGEAKLLHWHESVRQRAI